MPQPPSDPTVPQPHRDWKTRLRPHLLAVGIGAALLLALGLSGGGRDAARAEALASADLVEALLDDAERPLVPAQKMAAWRRADGALGGAGLAQAGLGRRPAVRLRYSGPPGAEGAVRGQLERHGLVVLAADAPGPALGVVVLDIQADGATLRATGRLEAATREGAAPDEEGGAAPTQAARIAGPWWSVLPPLVAVLLALLYRRVLLALGAAVVLGALLAAGFNPVTAATGGFERYIWGSVTDTFKLYVMAFTLALVGMVHVAARSGGNRGLVEAVGRLARTARSTRVVTALMGLVVFFDDYANSLIVGSSARSLTDRMRISREKLAYLVDSTAAPIAGVALISTWVGYEIGLFEGLTETLGLAMSGFEVFLEILPLRFYCLFALVFVFVGAALSRDYGPMLRAEQRAQRTGQLVRPGASVAALDASPDDGSAPARWYNAATPVLVTVLGVVVGVALDGQAELAARGAARADLGTLVGWRDVFSKADNAMVLFWASMAGSATAIVMATTQRILSVGQALRAWVDGMQLMALPLGILLLAWCMQLVTRDLGTSYYLVSVLEPVLHPQTLPLAVFLAAAAVAFATGTSWGTMGILLPALIPMAWAVSGDLGLTLLCMGAILDGAIFGDHCSPISDTTVMSSIASGCDHIDHVRTQLPYALTVMAIAGVCGYVALPLGLSLPLVYGLGVVCVVAVFYVVGTRLEDGPAVGVGRRG